MSATGNRLLFVVNHGVAIALSVVAAVVAGCTGEPAPPSVESYLDADIRSLLSVSDPDLPNDVLFDWPSDTSPRVLGHSQVDETTLERLRFNADVFDCEPYLMDDALRTALQGAGHLTWLRVGTKTIVEDLRWVGELSRLRGLSLRGADLSKADLGFLRALVRLQWLDLSNTVLPAAANSQFPSLPCLEVLYLADAHVTDDQIPVNSPSPKLKAICVRGSLITDAGLASLVDAYPNLQYLHLSRSPNITRQSLPVLMKLKRLEYLHIGGTPIERALSWNQFLELRKQFSGCDVQMGD